MSWDVFIQKLPAGLRSIEELPEGYEPGPLGSRDEVIAAIRGTVGTVDFDDTGFARLSLPDGSIEIDIDDEDPICSVALFVRGGAITAGTVVELVNVLGGTALAPESTNGLFEPHAALEVLQSSDRAREPALAPPPPPGMAPRRAKWPNPRH